MRTTVWRFSVAGFHAVRPPDHANQRNAEALASIADLEGSAFDVARAIGEDEALVRGAGRRNVIMRARQLLEAAFESLPNCAPASSTIRSAARRRAAGRRRKTGVGRRYLKAIRDAALAFVDGGDEFLDDVMEELRYRIATRSPLTDQAVEDARVRIMTLYSAKGLEADAIVLAGLADQIIPGIPDQDGVANERRREEQRRLLYVSLTRARNELVISWPRSVSFGDASANQIRRDRVTTQADERRVVLSQSDLLPGNLGAHTRGVDWLRARRIEL